MAGLRARQYTALVLRRNRLLTIGEALRRIRRANGKETGLNFCHEIPRAGFDVETWRNGWSLHGGSMTTHDGAALGSLWLEWIAALLL